MTTDLEAEVEALPAMVDGRGLKLVYRGEVIKLIKAHHKAERAAREELARRMRRWAEYAPIAQRAVIKAWADEIEAADAQAKQERDEK